MKSAAKNIQLASYDDLFKTDEERQADAQERVQSLPLDRLMPFPNHPFKVLDDEKMQETVESIKERGVLVPILVRPTNDGNFEIVSGHRRHHASLLAGKTEIPAIVREMDDDTAILLMVDSNLQREELLPSEKAFAYKMKLDAMKRQGQRTDLTSAQIGRKLNTIQFRKYLAQHRFLADYRIETAEELQSTKNLLTAQLDTAVRERKPLYEERRHADEEQKEVLSLEISTRTAQIKSLRRELRLCAQIEADAERVQPRVHEATLIQKEERYHEPRQRSRRADDARSHPDFRSGGKVGGAGCEEPCGSVSSTGQREPETARQDPHERPASQR